MQKLTNIGKTGVISESVILTLEDGPGDVDGLSNFEDPCQHRSTTLSKSLDVWKALYASSCTAAKLQTYRQKTKNITDRRLIVSFTAQLFIRYRLTYVSGQRLSLDRAWSAGWSSLDRLRCIWRTSYSLPSINENTTEAGNANNLPGNDRTKVTNLFVLLS